MVLQGEEPVRDAWKMDEGMTTQQEGGIRKTEARSHAVSFAGEFEGVRKPVKDFFSRKKKNV